tara:strand:+ start:1210 stop:1935 length:726 start_codon:yes stop_codon:yes gene_type:complete
MSKLDEIEKIKKQLSKNFTVNKIENIQKEICEKIPDLFEKKAFFKMQPRPSSHELSREFSYYKYCIDHVTVDGIWAEFGVYKGTSSKYLSEMRKEKFPNLKSDFHGFDSFEGLPEKWSGTKSKKGTFNTGIVPSIPGVTFHKGWFKNTIPNFLEKNKENFAFIHVDCDIYSSTVDIFNNIKNRIIPGTVILFDELIGYKAWEQHEYKAFMEFVKDNNVEFEWLAFVANAGQAACKITKIGV